MPVYVRQVFDIKSDVTLPYREGIVWITDQLKEQVDCRQFKPETCGIYLATLDTGAAASVALWANALENGPGFANPADFPLTLANSSAAVIARALNIQGPNYTLSGMKDAVYAIFDQAIFDLSAHKESDQQGFVIAVDILKNTHCAGLYIATSNDEANLGMITKSGWDEPMNDSHTMYSPAEAMASFVKQFSTESECCLEGCEGKVYGRRESMASTTVESDSVNRNSTLCSQAVRSV